MISPAEIAETFYNARSMASESGFAAAKWLVDRDVPPSATTEPDPVLAARIVQAGKYFEMAAPEEDGVRAILILARDSFNPIDIVAWLPKAGTVLTWLGQACMLGEDELYQPRLDPNGALRVFREPLAWLQANRRGIVILSTRPAAGRLHGMGPLIAEDDEHGRALQKALSRPAPKILVPNPARKAA